MSWFNDSNAAAESLKPDNILVIAVDGDFPSGHLRLSTWLVPFDIAGNTFTAVGNLGKVPEVPENMQLTADTRTYELSGVDPAVIPESEIDNCFGRSWVEYICWMDVVTRKLVGYEINFEGRMDKVARKDGASPTIQVNVEHRLVTLDKTDGWCYTAAHQKAFYAGDTGLDQVASNGSIDITWGGGQANYPGPPPSSWPGGGGHYGQPVGRR